MKVINRLVVFCSVFPHDVPPPYLLRLAQNFATEYPVILIDLPTNQYKVGIKNKIKNLYKMAKFIVKPKGIFVWKPSKIFTHLDYLALKKYILFFKWKFRSKVVLYTTSPRKDKVYDYINKDLSVFDCYDNPDNELKLNSKNLVKHDFLCSSFPMLFKILKSIKKETYLISAGIHDHKKLDHNFRQHPMNNAVVFFGGISHRINYDWIEEAVKQLPDVNFYFIGETYLHKYYFDESDKKCWKSWKKIIKQKNVFYWDTFIEPNFSPNILSLFKVGLIPYDINDSYNYNSHPIKLYDYIASGLITISTPIPSMLEYKNKLPIYFANNSKEFISLIKKYTNKKTKLSNTEVKNINKILKSQNLEKKLKQCNQLFDKFGI